MPAVALIPFLLLPLAEIAVFVLVGGAIGVGPTLALVLISACGGLAIVRLQGLATLRRARAALDLGELPAAELFNGACLLLAGILLLIPGFLTDFVGLLLLVPLLRTGLRVWLGRRLGVKSRRDGRREAAVIDGEFAEVDAPDAGAGAGDARRLSPWLRDDGGQRRA